MSRSLDPDLLLRAYAIGVFPMADDADADDVVWVEPRRRGIIPLDRFRLPRDARRLLRQECFEHRIDTAFDEVVAACAEARPGRESTWINSQIRTGYSALHDRGFAHSVECWRGKDLVGGLYGVRLGGAFFGESMFTRETGASKVALGHLVARMRAGGFVLLDTQFLTEHLARFGAVEVERDTYRRLLDTAVQKGANLFALGAQGTSTVAGPVSGNDILQALTHTS